MQSSAASSASRAKHVDELSIRPLAAGEVEALAALAREIWLAHYPPIIGAAQTEYMLAQRYAPQVVREELGRDDLWWDVLTRGGRMIAFASSFVLDERTLKLDKLYVHPNDQRRGYGGLLISHVAQRAAGRALERIVLAVNKHNASAIGAYRRHGFDIVDAIVKDIGGGFVMDDYVMARAVK